MHASILACARLLASRLLCFFSSTPSPRIGSPPPSVTVAPLSLPSCVGPPTDPWSHPSLTSSLDEHHGTLHPAFAKTSPHSLPCAARPAAVHPVLPAQYIASCRQMWGQKEPRERRQERSSRERRHWPPSQGPSHRQVRFQTDGKSRDGAVETRSCRGTRRRGREAHRGPRQLRN